jgi:hypothetical protein
MPKDSLNFLEFLQTFRRGELLRLADLRREEVVSAVHATSGEGSITLSFKFKINKAGQLEVKPELSSKKPYPALGTGIYFATEDGDLLRRDPTQHEMFEDELEERRSRRDLDF